MRLIVILLLTGNGFIEGHSQNLILNPSYEQFDSCTYLPGNINVLSNWKNGNKASPDFYTPCNMPFVSVPFNQVGYQYANDSISYIGIGFTDDINTVRESVLGTISTPLEKGHIYCFGLFLNIANISEYSFDKIQVYFSEDTIINTDFLFNNNTLIPQLTFDISGFSDTANWLYFEEKYTADGNERFFLISNFENNPIWIKINDTINNPYKVAYYNIDNVSMVECEQPIVIIPNVFSPNGDGINDIFYITNIPALSQLQILNRWGNIVYQSTSYQNDWKGTNTSGQTISDGTYFYILQTPDGKTYTGTLNSFGHP